MANRCDPVNKTYRVLLEIVDMPISIHWFRRDFRLEDNAALYHALKSGNELMPLFIFDKQILSELPKDDARVGFIHQTLEQLKGSLEEKGGGIEIRRGDPETVWKEILKEYEVAEVFVNKDYEPYALERDDQIETLLGEHGIPLRRFKDQVIFEEGEVVKADGMPYTVYTPYSKLWLSHLEEKGIPSYPSELIKGKYKTGGYSGFPSLEDLGFEKSRIEAPPYRMSDELLEHYQDTRDLPARDGTSQMSPYLRFGLVSIRDLVRRVSPHKSKYLRELIWREFYMQILYHFPHVVDKSFKARYDLIEWKNDVNLFECWKEGTTGYPLVDAGMRELKATGMMHNRVRMVAASFLCKHLLIDWRWGEAYFAEKLLDYELSSNNGNWQWAAGCGCDAAPYFRVFNPYLQQAKFDPDFEYIKKWVPEYGDASYPDPIVDHKEARAEALRVYRLALKGDPAFRLTG